MNNNKRIIPQAPISSNITGDKQMDQSWMLWMNKVGVHLNNATQTKQIKTNDQIINYSVNGNMTMISYKGVGGFESKLPNSVAIDSIIQTNDNGVIGHIVLNSGDRTIHIPTLSDNGLVSGMYFNG
jgi:hypothetical protein